jgi:hypothetical protein
MTRKIRQLMAVLPGNGQSGKICWSCQIRQPSITSKGAWRRPRPSSIVDCVTMRVLVCLLVGLTTLVPPGTCICQLIHAHNALATLSEQADVLAAREEHTCRRCGCCYTDRSLTLCGQELPISKRHAPCCPAFEKVDHSKIAIRSAGLAIETSAQRGVATSDAVVCHRPRHETAGHGAISELPLYLTFQTYLI